MKEPEWQLQQPQPPSYLQAGCNTSCARVHCSCTSVSTNFTLEPPSHLRRITSWTSLSSSIHLQKLCPYIFFSFKRETNRFQSHHNFYRCLITVAPALPISWAHAFAELKSLWAGMMHRVRTHLFSSLAVKRSMQTITVGSPTSPV